MNIIDIITRRKSVRTFDAEATISTECISALREYIKEVSEPRFGGKVTLRLEEFDLKGQYKPSTYGVIKGARWFLLMGIGATPESELSAGYMMEQVVLRATELGLGTCWIAATFKGSDFETKASFPADEPLRIISPVGIEANKRSFTDTATRFIAGSDRRKDFDSLFYADDSNGVVSVESPFRKPLEMLRLAPSATNSQPWRATVDGDSVTFYIARQSKTAVLDLGIGLSHFEAVINLEGYHGTWQLLTDHPATPQGYLPVIRFTLG